MQGVFLRWARPLAPAFAAAVYGILELVHPAPRVLHIIYVLLASIAAGVLYRLAAERFAPRDVLRVALPLDTLLIAGMTVALGRPGLLAIAYFWSVALAAVLLGSRETAGNALLAMACAGVVPYLANADVDYAIVVTDVLVLGLIGGLLTLLPVSVEHAEEVLARERRVDASALAIAERIRPTLEVDRMIEGTLDELLRATGASWALVRLSAGGAPVVAKAAPGRPPLALAGPSPIMSRVIDDARPLVVHDADAAPPDVAQYMHDYGLVSLIAYPLIRGGIVTGAAGVCDARPRRWRTAIALLDRVVPQLSAALAQAQIFEQQRETVDRLEEVARLREELVASVSHELRTPLTTTIGFLKTLHRTDVAFSPEQERQYLTLALGQAERLARLVDDLLDLTRLQRGSLPLRPERIEVGAVVREIVSLLPEAQPHPPQLELDDDLHASVDPQRLHQVLGNLVTNAFKHGEGEVAVTGVRDGRRVRVEVADGGPDIAPDIVPHLFVPFARWSTRSDGSGLGLAIARSLVEAHGGTLTYRPSREGRPHAFVVELPAA
jgi:signal transduction histidine kinase